MQNVYRLLLHRGYTQHEYEQAVRRAKDVSCAAYFLEFVESSEEFAMSGAPDTPDWFVRFLMLAFIGRDVRNREELGHHASSLDAVSRNALAATFAQCPEAKKVLAEKNKNGQMGAFVQFKDAESVFVQKLFYKCIAQSCPGWVPAICSSSYDILSHKGCLQAATSLCKAPRSQPPLP